ncbi:MAG TPA: fibronectin type III domain-containing protein [Candidatus Dojkabacteria bacterium]|nr:fibronectin type III domain-containing protein [Candidatus Dojkabacteria bacterium]
MDRIPQKSLKIVSKVVLALLVVSLLGYIGYMVYLSAKFKPQKVRVTNVTDTAFTVSWITDEPMVGVVYYGEKDIFLPGPLAILGKKKAVDDRDVSDAQTECVERFNREVSKTKTADFTVSVENQDNCNDIVVKKYGKYYVHHVTVQDLDADKDYYFRVGNGWVTSSTSSGLYSEKEFLGVEKFSAKTMPLFEEIGVPNTAYGSTYSLYYDEEGQLVKKTDFDSIIFLRVKKGEQTFPLLSGVSNSDGGWTIDIGNIRNEDGSIVKPEDLVLTFVPQAENHIPANRRTVNAKDAEYPLFLLGNGENTWDGDEEKKDLLETLWKKIGRSVSAAEECSGSEQWLWRSKSNGCECVDSDNGYSTKELCEEKGVDNDKDEMVMGSKKRECLDEDGCVCLYDKQGNNYMIRDDVDFETYCCPKSQRSNNGTDSCDGEEDDEDNVDDDTDDEDNVDDDTDDDEWEDKECFVLGTGGGSCLKLKGLKCKDQETVSRYATDQECLAKAKEKVFYLGLEPVFDPAKVYCAECEGNYFVGDISTVEGDRAACIKYGGSEAYETFTGCTEKIPNFKAKGSKYPVSITLAKGESNAGYVFSAGPHSSQADWYISQKITNLYDCCQVGVDSYAVMPRKDGKEGAICQEKGVGHVPFYRKCAQVDSFFAKFMYCVYPGPILKSYFYPYKHESYQNLSCPNNGQMGKNIGGYWDLLKTEDGTEYACEWKGEGKYKFLERGTGNWTLSTLSKCVSEGAVHPSVVRGVATFVSSTSSVLGVEDNSKKSEKQMPFLYYPEKGMYRIETSLGDGIDVFGDTENPGMFYVEKNGIPGYQFPSDPYNLQDNEDIAIADSALVLEISQTTTAQEYELKEGVNIISFDLVPSEGDAKQLTSDRFLEIVNQAERKVSRVAYFSGGQWAGGTAYDFEAGATKGATFSFAQGRGYLVMAEKDTTISVPGYKVKESIPIALSSGWNLVGIHGHSRRYTAKSLINSINSIEGLKANNVTFWPTNRGMYQGYQQSEGQAYGQDFPIVKDLGYFIRISEFNPKQSGCKSILWNPGGQKNGECGTQLN